MKTNTSGNYEFITCHTDTINTEAPENWETLAAYIFDENPNHWKKPVKWDKQKLTFIIYIHETECVEERILPNICKNIKEQYNRINRGGFISHLKHVNGNLMVFQQMDKFALEKTSSYLPHFVRVKQYPSQEPAVINAFNRMKLTNGYLIANKEDV